MKAIKFNLGDGEHLIRTVAELKEHSNIDILLETLNSGLLERWLQAQGDTDLLKKIQAIDKSNKRQACDALCRAVFGEDSTTAQQVAAELFDFRIKEEKRREMLKELKEKEDTIIAQYHKGYDDILAALRHRSADYASLKADMRILYEHYPSLLKLDAAHFYKTFKNDYPLVLLALTANKELREFIGYDNQRLYKDIMPQLGGENPIESIITKLKNGEDSPAVKLITLDQLTSFRRNNKGKTVLRLRLSPNNYYMSSMCPVFDFERGDYYVDQAALEIKTSPIAHIKIFRGKTDQYWKDIEPKGTQCMIISIKKENKLRNAGKNGEKLTDADINGQFIFTDGIDYMSNSDTDTLIYMEV